MSVPSNYQAKLAAPFGVLGIHCDGDVLTGIEFLPPDTLLQAPESALAQGVRDQLLAYFDNPDFQFDLPLRVGGTVHQNKVWCAMCSIPCGQTQQYGEIARRLGSSPRAVGQACGNNPIPIIIPCHRVVSKSGMGGFNHHNRGYALEVKRWLLMHEGAIPSPVPVQQGMGGRKR